MYKVGIVIIGRRYNRKSFKQSYKNRISNDCNGGDIAICASRSSKFAGSSGSILKCCDFLINFVSDILI